jgi:hypothetical protein
MNTMNCCAPICTNARPTSTRGVAQAALALAVALAFSPAQAQAPRQFPANALRGDMVITEPPELILNGKTAARLAPGGRIWGTNNMLQLSGGLVDQKLLVNYTLDWMGQLSQVWILREDEAANKPWPRTAEQAAVWIFDPQAQRWTATTPVDPPTTGRH